MEIAMWDKARAFERIHKIVDPDCKLSLSEVVKLVEEKFTTEKSVSEQKQIQNMSQKCHRQMDLLKTEIEKKYDNGEPIEHAHIISRLRQIQSD